ncbi:unnamed protein product [Gadus morhua 'NCC']
MIDCRRVIDSMISRMVCCSKCLLKDGPVYTMLKEMREYKQLPSNSPYHDCHRDTSGSFHSVRNSGCSPCIHLKAAYSSREMGTGPFTAGEEGPTEGPKPNGCGWGRLGISQASICCYWYLECVCVWMMAGLSSLTWPELVQRGSGRERLGEPAISRQTQ